MYELTLHVQPVGTHKCVEVIAVNSNYMHNKIARFMRLVSDWDFEYDKYYDALVFLKKIQICSKGLNILLDMGLEPHMKKQVWQVFKLLEEVCWEIEKFKVEENGTYSHMYLRWKWN